MTSVVDSWTGARAAALRAALRLTNEALADRLGTSVRAVSNWNTDPALVPRPEIQRALDTLLMTATEEERARFGLLLPQADRGLSGTAAHASGDSVIQTRYVVDLGIDAAGWARVLFSHHLVNRTSHAFSRLTREAWFETTRGSLDLEVFEEQETDRRVMIQRIHETPSMCKFACRLLPALQPGEATVVSYSVSGGRFIHDHYWRQSIMFPTEDFALTISHSGLKDLTRCTVTEELPDGSELVADDGLSWQREHHGIVISLSRRALLAGQSLTVRWGPES